MPRAEIASKQAVYTLGLLHAELAGKLLANKREAIRLRTAMMQVEAVVKMLRPGFNVASIAAKRRNKSNPWFKRGTLFRSVVDVLRRAATPMTAREIADALIADKTPQHAVALDHPPAVLASLIDNAVGMQRVTPTTDQLQEPDARALGDAARCADQRRRERAFSGAGNGIGSHHQQRHDHHRLTDPLEQLP